MAPPSPFPRPPAEVDVVMVGRKVQLIEATQLHEHRTPAGHCSATREPGRSPLRPRRSPSYHPELPNSSHRLSLNRGGRARWKAPDTGRDVKKIFLASEG